MQVVVLVAPATAKEMVMMVVRQQGMGGSFAISSQNEFGVVHLQCAGHVMPDAGAGSRVATSHLAYEMHEVFPRTAPSFQC